MLLIFSTCPPQPSTWTSSSATIQACGETEPVLSIASLSLLELYTFILPACSVHMCARVCVVCVYMHVPMGRHICMGVCVYDFMCVVYLCTGVCINVYTSVEARG